ncbi:MAG: hypothetical protein JNM39_16630 [Bdellovibrionaceae bacterium]|nr:hypothetical protein [Pseudobdellovibrionaceae bacterium]
MKISQIKFLIEVRVFHVLVLSVVLIGLGAQFAKAANAGITYHGRLIDPAGNSVVGASVQFKIQLRTPGVPQFFTGRLKAIDILL